MIAFDTDEDDDDDDVMVWICNSMCARVSMCRQEATKSPMSTSMKLRAKGEGMTRERSWHHKVSTFSNHVVMVVMFIKARS